MHKSDLLRYIVSNRNALPEQAARDTRNRGWVMHMPATTANLTDRIARRLGALALATSLAGFAPGVLAQPADAEEREIKPCVECHEAFFGIADSRHFVRGDARTPAGSGEECGACHGDSSAHNKAPRAKDRLPIRFGVKAPAGPQNDKCLACHQTGARIHWQGSAHDRSQQACASCHKAHAAKDPVLVAETQAAVCFECHKDRRAEMFKLSTHPLKAGFFACSSCHQPHGSTTRALLQKTTVNDTCYTCHADKRGPFLWEHRSAQDDCTHCHNPHGTNNPPMLKVRQPYLCQQCHQSVNHSTPAFSGTNLNPANANAQRVIARSCANCHTKVHGTNHPSGARFQR
jgi:DmsE family decaheme c-type cytochrome